MTDEPREVRADARRIVSRREFITVTATVGGGLLVTSAFHLGVWDDELASAAATRFGPLLEITPENLVIVSIPVPEIGQGVRTSLSMLVAEELDANWDEIEVRQADAADDLGPHPFAGGSWSVRAYWNPLRELGATTRELLVRAAAAEWQVDAAECETRDSQVFHASSRRSLTYGAVAERASRLVPAENVPLRPPAAWRLIGTERRGVDVSEIARGTREFGSDVRRPGMRFAVILRSPVFGGSLIRYDASDALRVRGVEAVHEITPIGRATAPTVAHGIAVVATNTWAALEGRKRLRPVWEPGPHATTSTARLREECLRLLDGDGSVYRESGDVGRPAEGVRVSARYHLPFLAHASMEPPDCTVEVRADAIEIWAPTQMPVAVRGSVARTFERPLAEVIVHVTAIGGGFGRRLDSDFVLEAVAVASKIEGPVQVVWTRDDDLRHGFFRPYGWHQLDATLSPSGALLRWTHRQAGTSRYANRPSQHPGRSEFLAGVWPADLAQAFRLTYAVSESPFDRGPLRAPGNNSLVFAVESFLDEAARAIGRDPLQLRRELLSPTRAIPFDDEDTHFETDRMLAVLESAAAAARWGASRPADVGVGIAGAFVFGTYVAHVIEVHVDRRTGAVTPREVWSAIDCGQVVSPSGVRAQVEGGVIDALSNALYGEITITDGQIDQSNFHDYRLLRGDLAPVIRTQLLQSDRAPTGAGEPPYPPAIPAFANAIYTAVGARVRELPITPERVLRAIGIANARASQNDGRSSLE